MTFLSCNKWRKAYLEAFDFSDDVEVPLDDPDAYRMNPKHHWVYNKLSIAELQGIEAGPFGVTPTLQPLFSKPIYNLSSMGVDARKFDTIEAYEGEVRAGTMWCAYLQGEHSSVDLVLLNGKVEWFSFTHGYPLEKGMFDYWEINVTPQSYLKNYVIKFVQTHLPDYTGAVNVEVLGDKIIEVHLRIAGQWLDLYGEDFIRALHNLYRDGQWDYNQWDYNQWNYNQWNYNQKQKTSYSVVAFAPPDYYENPPQEVWEKWCATSEVFYIQLPSYTESGKFNTMGMPQGGMRLAVINATNLERAQNLRTEILDWYGFPLSRE